MTLRELMVLANCPLDKLVRNFLGNCTVNLKDDYCRFAIHQYMMSAKFQSDQNDCVLDAEDFMYSEYDVNLYLERDAKTKIFTLKVIPVDDDE